MWRVLRRPSFPVGQVHRKLPLHCILHCRESEQARGRQTILATTGSSNVTACLPVCFHDVARCFAQNGRLPLHYAVMWGAGQEVVAALLQANPDATSKVDRVRSGDDLGLCVYRVFECASKYIYIYIYIHIYIYIYIHKYIFMYI